MFTRDATRRSPLIRTAARLRGFETMEPRCLLAGDTIDVGMIYVEQDAGSDLHGDSFELTFSGGVEGTQLKQVVVDGDQTLDGFSIGDSFFDISATGFGTDGSKSFTLGIHDGIDSVIATVVDGDTRLVLDFEGFDAGERLVFDIDVDEVEDYSSEETDLEYINDGFDPITSGVEFQGTVFQATFTAQGYFHATDSDQFFNRYDRELEASGLPLPADDDAGQRDRTAGAFLLDIEQEPEPSSIRGRVQLANQNGDCFGEEEDHQPVVGATVYLLNSDGEIIAETLSDSNGEYEFLGLAPGTYSVREITPDSLIDGGAQAGGVDGDTRGSVDDSGTVVDIQVGAGEDIEDVLFCELESVSISGRVQESTREGDCFGENVEHNPIVGATVQLLDEDGVVIAETLTDDNGEYRFEGLVPGTYGLRELTPDDLIDGGSQVGSVDGLDHGLTNDGGDILQIDLNSGEDGTGYDFCDHVPAMISGHVYVDQNESATRDEGEQPIADVTMELIDENGDVVATTTTDADGFYKFNGVTAGVYSVHEQQPEGYFDGAETPGRNNGETSGVPDEPGDTIRQINIGWGDSATDLDFGELLGGLIEGRVHSEIVRNCVFEPEIGEVVMPGVTVQLVSDTGDILREAVTDSEGRYRFDDIAPGDYRIREIQPETHFDVGAVAGEFGDVGVSENEIAVSVGSGAVLTGYDFCETPPVQLSGYVFQDGPPVELVEGEDLPERVRDVRDGKRTSDDSYLSGVTMVLRHGTSGDALSPADWALPGYYTGDTISVTTDSSGFYQFDGVRAGTYAVYQQDQPEGLVDGVDTPGTASGIVFNPGEPQDEAFKNSLAVDPQNDAIASVNVAPGTTSVENNFSEVAVNYEPPPVEPPVEPPTFPPPRIPITPVPPPTQIPLSQAPGFSPPVANGGGYQGQTIGSVGLIGKLRSWHLSIINGGHPRGDGVEVERVSPDWMNEAARNSRATALRSAEWSIPTSYGYAETDAGPSRGTATFGMAGAIPFAGDFDGDGDDEIGVFFIGEWYIDMNGNGRWDEGDLWAKMGRRSDLPVVGDWDGDGKADIGVFGKEWKGDRNAIASEPGLPDAENGVIDVHKNVPPNRRDAASKKRLLQGRAKDPVRADVVDHVFRYGKKDDLPIAGDWNGDGIATIGVFREGKWTLDVDGNGFWSNEDAEFDFGRRGDLPVTGDFDGDGIDDVAIVRQGEVIIDTNRNGYVDSSDRRIAVGRPGQIAVAGDFDGDGIDEIAFYEATGEERITYQARR